MFKIHPVASHHTDCQTAMVVLYASGGHMPCTVFWVMEQYTVVKSGISYHSCIQLPLNWGPAYWHAHLKAGVGQIHTYFFSHGESIKLAHYIKTFVLSWIAQGGLHVLVWAGGWSTCSGLGWRVVLPTYRDYSWLPADSRISSRL